MGRWIEAFEFLIPMVDFAPFPMILAKLCQCVLSCLKELSCLQIYFAVIVICLSSSLWVSSKFDSLSKTIECCRAAEFPSQSNRMWLEMQIEKIYVFCIYMELDCYKNKLGTVNVRKPWPKLVNSYDMKTRKEVINTTTDVLTQFVEA